MTASRSTSPPRSRCPLSCSPSAPRCSWPSRWSPGVLASVAWGMGGGWGAGRRRRGGGVGERLGAGALADARPGELGGGEGERGGLARALALGPGALLLDEPLAALDVRTRARAA